MLQNKGILMEIGAVTAAKQRNAEINAYAANIYIYIYIYIYTAVTAANQGTLQKMLQNKGILK
jgi:hypothetical protein